TRRLQRQVPGACLPRGGARVVRVCQASGTVEVCADPSLAARAAIRKSRRERVMPVGNRVLGDPERLAQLLDICEALPEIDVSGEQHIAFRIGKKTFAYYLDDHHGDGMVSICCKSTRERQAELVERHPGRYYVPDYVGPKGWVALRLDLPHVNWAEVTELKFAAYRLQAPRRLAEQVK